MKRFLAIFLTISLLCVMAAGCSGQTQETAAPETTVPETTVPETTVPETTVPATTEAPVYTSFYYFYNYQSGDYIYSDVATFQEVAGAVCLASALDYGFLDDEAYEYISEGYDAQYAIFMYAYDAAQIDAYVAYLETMGFAYQSSENFSQGKSDYYLKEANGCFIDFFYKTDAEGNIEYVALEPCMNRDSTEESSCYYFYDYETGEYVYSDVLNYQNVTGAVCTHSALDFGFLSDANYEYMIEGYDERYGVFLYEYDEAQLNAYMSYLESLGFENVNTQSYNEGKSYYYQNPETGYLFDIFVKGNVILGYEYLAIEPYMNAETE